MPKSPLKVAWISYFPVEWLPDLPEPLRALQRLHPATWQRVLLDELKNHANLELHILSLGKQFPHHYTFQRDGVTFHCLKASLKLRVVSLFWWDTILIRGRLRGIQPDLVHAWGSERGAALVASRLSHPNLVTMQGLLEWYLQQTDLGWFARIEAQLEKTALRRARLATTESKFAVEWLRKHYPHLELRQVEHAPSWVFHRLERQPEIKPLRFLFIGPMSRLKGTDLLLMALDRLRAEIDFRLAIIGSSPPDFVREMKTATSAALWERIDIRNGLTQAEIANELTRATMMIFPTRADTSPNSVKEAVVAGVPVVASAVGGIVDYVVPGRNGLTFPAQDLDALIASVRQAVAHPLFSVGRVENETLKQKREYLSPAVMAERFLACYSECQ